MGSFRFRSFVGATAVALVVGLLQWTPASATAVSSISAGGTSSCALTSVGGVKCWGVNEEGQLGDGSGNDSTTPVNVSGLTSGVAAISAGFDHTCALTTAGAMKCWGYNGHGQLGDGTTTNAYAPVVVSGLTSGVTAISSGDFHTCAVVSGGAKCWGYNSSGELGDGTNTTSFVPVDVSGLTSGVAAISAGDGVTCAVTTAGGAKCWGYDGAGELGDGTNTTSFVPVDVSGLTSGVAAISAGDGVTCAVTTAGGAKCWGYNGYGQLGDGTNTTSNAPVDVFSLTSGVAAISAGGDNTCAVTTAGGAKCWGYNGYGELGDGTNDTTNAPVDVFGLTSGVASISAGAGHTCAMTSVGSAKCWGSNEESYYSVGSVGDGTIVNRNTPGSVVGLTVGAKVPKIKKIPATAIWYQTITIKGKNLTDVVDISFNGTSATTFTGSGKKLHVEVPFGASSGKVTIITPGGVATSAKTITIS
jgi:alpha-tubulin suppressor-like RCC1 family protein